MSHTHRNIHDPPRTSRSIERIGTDRHSNNLNAESKKVRRSSFLHSDNEDDTSVQVEAPTPAELQMTSGTSVQRPRSNFLRRHQYSPPRRPSPQECSDSNDKYQESFHRRCNNHENRSTARKQLHPSDADLSSRRDPHMRRPCRDHSHFAVSRHTNYCRRRRSSSYSHNPPHYEHNHRHHECPSCDYSSQTPSSYDDGSYSRSGRPSQASYSSTWSETTSEPLSERIHRWATSTPKDVYIVGRIKGVDPKDDRECLRLEHIKSVKRRRGSLQSRRDSARSRRDSTRRDSARSRRNSAKRDSARSLKDSPQSRRDSTRRDSARSQRDTTRRDSARSQRDTTRRDSARSRRRSTHRCEDLERPDTGHRTPTTVSGDGRSFVSDRRCDNHPFNCRCDLCAQQRFMCSCQSCLLALWDGSTRFREAKTAGNIVVMRIPQYGASEFQPLKEGRGLSSGGGSLNESNQRQLLNDWIRLSQTWCLPLVKQMNDQLQQQQLLRIERPTSSSNVDASRGNDVIDTIMTQPEISEEDVEPSSSSIIPTTTTSRDPLQSASPFDHSSLGFEASMVVSSTPTIPSLTLHLPTHPQSTFLNQATTAVTASNLRASENLRSPPAKRHCGYSLPVHDDTKVEPITHHHHHHPISTSHQNSLLTKSTLNMNRNLSLCTNVVSIEVPPQESAGEMDDPVCPEYRQQLSDDDDGGGRNVSDECLQKLRQAGHLILESVLDNVPCKELPDGSITIKTPHRFSKMMIEMTEGYRLDPKEVIQGAIFNARNSNTASFSSDPPTEVVIRDLPVASLCEHHLLPFHGTCSIAYLPKNHVLGLSKFSRVVDVFAHRLQLQERLTEEVAHFLNQALDPYALAVTVTAAHGCMILRGVRTVGSSTTTRCFVADKKLDFELKDRFRDQLFSLLK